MNIHTSATPFPVSFVSRSLAILPSTALSRMLRSHVFFELNAECGTKPCISSFNEIRSCPCEFHSYHWSKRLLQPVFITVFWRGAGVVLITAFNYARGGRDVLGMQERLQVLRFSADHVRKWFSCPPVAQALCCINAQSMQMTYKSNLRYSLLVLLSLTL